jgi:tetratricopeptide (TPR) repeat protein
MMRAVQKVIVIALLALSGAAASPPAGYEESFRQGVEQYRASEWAGAAGAFQRSVRERIAPGTLQNLGLAEWRLGRNGAAVLAWERALWLDPYDPAARQNLRYARKTAQLESPELAWYEVVSTWLPLNWWAGIAGVSFWLGIALAVLPGTFGTRRRAWQQALAAVAIMVFLLALPGYAGIRTRSRVGFILEKSIPLRLTPTASAQAVTYLASGDPARALRVRGDYVLIRAHRAVGWVKRDQLGLVSGSATGS